MEKDKKKKGGSVGLCLLGILFLILFAFTFYGVWMNYRYVVVKVVESSMETTLHDGDYIYVNRRAEAQRGDVIIIDVSKEEYKGLFRAGTELIVKRLIAVEGDAVKCEDGAVYIRYAGTEEFVLLEEDYVHFKTPDFDTVELQEGQIFFLGDHRNSSVDSVDVGCLTAEDVFGVVPHWAIEFKKYSTAWEGFRSNIYEWFH